MTLPNRHPGLVYGHSRGMRPGSKHYYRPTLSGGKWDQFCETRALGDVLQICCGGSMIGTVRVDSDPTVPGVTVVADMLALPFRGSAFETVAADPMYNLDYPTRVFVQRELGRVAARRVLFKGPWVPRMTGFTLIETLLVLSDTCANVAVMSVLDRAEELQEALWSPTW